MRVLVAFERSGIVRDAFSRRGHDATSCDIRPTNRPGQHITGNAMRIIERGGWDLIIAHPPCTFLCSSGIHHNARDQHRRAKTEQAIEMILAIMAAPAKRIAIENPIGIISTRIRPADQYIQPYEFGDDASKRTGLWLKNLPPLKPTDHIPGRLVCCGKILENGDKYGCPNCNGDRKAVRRWGNQLNSGQSRVPPSSGRRAEMRSATYQGIAEAMASQWGKV